MAGWADDGVDSDQAMAADATGRAAIERDTRAFLDAFRDAALAPVGAWAAGDYVAQLATLTGTKAGRPVKLTVADVLHFRDGKLDRRWRFYDASALAAQVEAK